MSIFAPLLTGRSRHPDQPGPGAFGPSVAPRLRRPAVTAALRLGLRQAYVDLDSLAGLEGRPLVFLPNHVCNWDAMLAAAITDRLGREFAMAAAPMVLRRWPLLRRFGVFPVERGAQLRTARELRALGLRVDAAVNGALWYFPQGGHVRTGVEAEPERGALVLAGATLRARLVPVAFHYELFERRRPIAWVKTMPAHSAATLNAPLDRLLASASEALADDLRVGSGSYRPLLHGDRNTVLVDNVPCDRRRLDGALQRANVAPSFATVARLRGAALAELQPRVVAAVLADAGPLYARLVTRALERQGERTR